MKTSYFAKLGKSSNAVSITGRAPEWFSGRQYKKLAPKLWFYKKYKEDGDEEFYKLQYQKEVLDVLDPKTVYEELSENSVLLCWELPGQFCHRHLVAEWFMKHLNVKVYEMLDFFTEEEIVNAEKIVERFKKPKEKIDIFYNLCFCILVPQTRFSTVSTVIQKLKDNGFYSSQISREKLLELISSIRFKNRKVDYLLKMKNEYDLFYSKLNEVLLQTDSDSRAKRKFVIGRIKGMGLKASSHFLRNLGLDDLAIVDTHILQHLCVKDKKFDYFNIEDEIRFRAASLNVSVAVYDALIWKQRSGTKDENFIY
jgi:thermostable 8-oxoguanine DNA glycosylase